MPIALLQRSAEVLRIRQLSIRLAALSTPSYIALPHACAIQSMYTAAGSKKTASGDTYDRTDT